jgi:serine/threonine protein kinase
MARICLQISGGSCDNRVVSNLVQAMTLKTGDRLGRYEILAPLGAGGMGEARAASALDHPNICTVYEIDETEEGRLFIAMAFYGGETLKKRIERGPLPIDEAIGVAIQVAEGLRRAHETGIVHRDIKPANVIVTARSEAKIVDFGLAKLAGEFGLTQTGSTVGTPHYMSPEQARGDQVGPATDIWSLGVVLYEMVTGQRPFHGESGDAGAFRPISVPLWLSSGGRVVLPAPCSMFPAPGGRGVCVHLRAVLSYLRSSA